jgi:peroxiredoxin Q/BCP
MSRFVSGCLAAALLAWFAAPALAQEGPKEGDKAPVFEAKDDQGNVWKSSDHVGKKYVVVFFYPAAMTGGCTKQACGFRDAADELKNLNVEVVGVSGDEVPGLALFKKAESLNFPLLSDPKGEIAKKFGVPTRPGGSIEREVDGKVHTLTRGVSAARWTFVIDLDGNIIRRNTKVDAPKDSAETVSLIKSLSKKS